MSDVRHVIVLRDFRSMIVGSRRDRHDITRVGDEYWDWGGLLDGASLGE